MFLDATLLDLYRNAGRRLHSTVLVCDYLERSRPKKGFDLVVGNPPYGRVRLPPRLREKLSDSLFGHANLYGVFTDQALRFTRRGGMIAFVTPTSFLAGEYFKALRGLLGREAPPRSVGFVELRKGVFDDVLQETVLAVYSRGSQPATADVHFISPRNDKTLETTVAGSFSLPDPPAQPWLIPRNINQATLLRRAGGLRGRLADLGYTVSTGPLVWNRHKSSLCDSPENGSYPLLWAESVQSDGGFEFRAAKRNHKPYFKPKDKERWVVTDYPCVLVQRTTAKEQCRRLIAAELPRSFIAEHGAVVVENHLNMVRPCCDEPKVSPRIVAAILNSSVADELFRCINGSVAVSAYELEALPLPSAEAIATIEDLLATEASREQLEEAVARAYGCADT